MSKRLVIILAVVSAAVLGLIWWTVASLPPRVPDPVYNGHHLSYWLSPSGFTGPGSEYQEIAFIHTTLDSNALPYLVHALQMRDGPLRLAYDRLWYHLPGWLKARVTYPATAGETRGVTCVFLDGMGAAARPAIPDLIQVVLHDESEPVRNSAAYALVHIASQDDQRVIDALAAAATKDTDVNIRHNASGALVRFNPDAAAKAGVKDW